MYFYFRIGYLTYADYFFFCCFAFLAFNISLFLLVLIVRRNGRRTEKVGLKYFTSYNCSKCICKEI